MPLLARYGWIQQSKLYGHCRTLQYITIRKQEEELHASIEAGMPDEEIGKLARISHRVSALHVLVA